MEELGKAIGWDKEKAEEAAAAAKAERQALLDADTKGRNDRAPVGYTVQARPYISRERLD